MDLKKPFKALQWVFLLCLIFGPMRAIAGPLAISMCPQCFGFAPLNDQIWVENVEKPMIEMDFITQIEKSRAEVSAYFPEFKSKPKFLICLTKKCDEMAGVTGAKAQAYRSSLIFVTSRGLEPKFFTHELAHIAFHEIANGLLRPSGLYPAWFDEGLAVIISKDERYIKPQFIGKKACIETNIGDLPEDALSWAEVSGQDRMVYSRAACRVEIWLDKIGGLPKFYVTIKSNIANGEFKE